MSNIDFIFYKIILRIILILRLVIYFVFMKIKLVSELKICVYIFFIFVYEKIYKIYNVEVRFSF